MTYGDCADTVRIRCGYGAGRHGTVWLSKVVGERTVFKGSTQLSIKSNNSYNLWNVMLASLLVRYTN